LEETHVNLNQGAESAISYLMARLTVEKYDNHNDRKKDNHYLSFPENNSVKEKTMILAAMDNSSKQTSYYFIADPYGVTKKKLKRSKTWE
jgi:hypothetical protein